jgi:hypothetical protein
MPLDLGGSVDTANRAVPEGRAGRGRNEEVHLGGFSRARNGCILRVRRGISTMQLLKVVFTLIAVGGPSYALFRFSRNAAGWLKVLSLVLGFSTLIGTILVLPQALDALESTVIKVASYVSLAKNDLRREAQIDPRRKADASPQSSPPPNQSTPVQAPATPKPDNKLSTSGDNSPIVSGVDGNVTISIDGSRR